MKILGIVGSTRKGGNTEILVKEVLDAAKEEDTETELVFLSEFKLDPCNACHVCDMTSPPVCTIKDDIEKITALMSKTDGIVIGSPVYYGGVAAEVKIFFERVGYLDRCREKKAFKYRIGGAVVAARRSGMSAALSEIINFLLAMKMIVPGSARVSGLGNRRGEVKGDEEGMRAAQELGLDIAKLGKLTESLRKEN